MAYDCFLKIEGVSGSSTDDKNKGQIEIFSISWGASNTSGVGSSSGSATAGKVSMSEVHLMKKYDAASPNFLVLCANGKVLPKATIEFRKAAGENGQGTFLTIELTEVVVNSVQVSGSSGGDDTPTESLSLAFGQILTTYFKQDDKGIMGSPVKGGWNLTTNKKA